MLLALFECYERPLQVKARRPDVDASSSIATIISPVRCGVACWNQSRIVMLEEKIFWLRKLSIQKMISYQVLLVHGNRTVHGHVWISSWLGWETIPSVMTHEVQSTSISKARKQPLVTAQCFEMVVMFMRVHGSATLSLIAHVWRRVFFATCLSPLLEASRNETFPFFQPQPVM